MDSGARLKPDRASLEVHLPPTAQEGTRPLTLMGGPIRADTSRDLVPVDDHVRLLQRMVRDPDPTAAGLAIRDLWDMSLEPPPSGLPPASKPPLHAEADVDFIERWTSSKRRTR